MTPDEVKAWALEHMGVTLEEWQATFVSTALDPTCVAVSLSAPRRGRTVAYEVWHRIVEAHRVEIPPHGQAQRLAHACYRPSGMAEVCYCHIGRSHDA